MNRDEEFVSVAKGIRALVDMIPDGPLARQIMACNVESSAKSWSYNPESKKQLEEGLANAIESTNPFLRAMLTDPAAPPVVADTPELSPWEMAKRDPKYFDPVSCMCIPSEWATKIAPGHRKALQRARRPAILVRTDTATSRLKPAPRPIPGARKALRLAARGY